MKLITYNSSNRARMSVAHLGEIIVINPGHRDTISKQNELCSSRRNKAINLGFRHVDTATEIVILNLNCAPFHHILAKKGITNNSVFMHMRIAHTREHV